MNNETIRKFYNQFTDIETDENHKDHVVVKQVHPTLFVDFIQSEIQSAIAKEREKRDKHWIEMCEAHRPYCTSQGNKELTRIMGKKNRFATTIKNKPICPSPENPCVCECHLEEHECLDCKCGRHKSRE